MGVTFRTRPNGTIQTIVTLEGPDAKARVKKYKDRSAKEAERFGDGLEKLFDEAADLISDTVDGATILTAKGAQFWARFSNRMDKARKDLIGEEPDADAPSTDTPDRNAMSPDQPDVDPTIDKQSDEVGGDFQPNTDADFLGTTGNPAGSD